MNLGPPTNRKKPEPPKEVWRTVKGSPHIEENNDNPPKMRTKNWQPPPLPVPVVIDYGFDESGFPG
jgi:hypothetical protein